MTIILLVTCLRVNINTMPKNHGSNPENCFEHFPLWLIVMWFGTKDMITTRTPSTIPLQEDITFNAHLESIVIVTSNVFTFVRLMKQADIPTQLPFSTLSLEQSYWWIGATVDFFLVMAKPGEDAIGGYSLFLFSFFVFLFLASAIAFSNIGVSNHRNSPFSFGFIEVMLILTSPDLFSTILR